MSSRTIEQGTKILAPVAADEGVVCQVKQRLCITEINS